MQASVSFLGSYIYKKALLGRKSEKKFRIHLLHRTKYATFSESDPTLVIVEVQWMDSVTTNCFPGNCMPVCTSCCQASINAAIFDNCLAQNERIQQVNLDLRLPKRCLKYKIQFKWSTLLKYVYEYDLL